MDSSQHKTETPGTDGCHSCPPVSTTLPTRIGPIYIYHIKIDEIRRDQPSRKAFAVFTILIEFCVGILALPMMDDGFSVCLGFVDKCFSAEPVVFHVLCIEFLHALYQTIHLFIYVRLWVSVTRVYIDESHDGARLVLGKTYRQNTLHADEYEKETSNKHDYGEISFNTRAKFR